MRAGAALFLIAVVLSAAPVAGVGLAGAVEPKPRYTITDLGAFNDGWSSATAINERGDVVGRWGYPENHIARACLWRDGKMVELGVKHNEHSIAQAINDRGEVAGDLGGGMLHALPPRAFLFRSGKTEEL